LTEEQRNIKYYSADTRLGRRGRGSWG